MQPLESCLSRDLDLVMAAEAAGTADAALSALGEKRRPKPDARYETARFLTYTIDGVAVDVMAGFAIRHAVGAAVNKWLAEPIPERIKAELMAWRAPAKG